MTDFTRCDAIDIRGDVLWTCAQRLDHPGPHNEQQPGDGCTAWADHCPTCAEHDCICRR